MLSVEFGQFWSTLTNKYKKPDLIVDNYGHFMHPYFVFSQFIPQYLAETKTNKMLRKEREIRRLEIHGEKGS